MLDKYLVTSVNNSFAISNLFIYDDKGYLLVNGLYSTRIPDLSITARNKFIEEYLLNLVASKETGEGAKSIVYTKDKNISSSLELYNTLKSDFPENITDTYSRFISNSFKTDNLNIFVFDEEEIQFIPFTRNSENIAYKATINMVDMLEDDQLLNSLKNIWIKQHGFADKFDLLINHSLIPEYGINSEYMLRSSAYYDIYVLKKFLDSISDRILDAPIFITGNRVARNNNPKYSLITFLYSLIVKKSTLVYVDTGCVFDNLKMFEIQKGSALNFERSKNLDVFKIIKLKDKKNSLGRYDSMASIKIHETEINPYKNSLWSVSNADKLKINTVKGVEIANPNYFYQDWFEEIIIDTLTQEDDKERLVDSIEHLLDHLSILK